MISIKNKVKIDEKPYKNILIYYIVYLLIKDLRYVKMNGVNPLYLIIDKTNGENVMETNN